MQGITGGCRNQGNLYRNPALVDWRLLVNSPHSLGSYIVFELELVDKVTGGRKAMAFAECFDRQIGFEQVIFYILQSFCQELLMDGAPCNVFEYLLQALWRHVQVEGNAFRGNFFFVMGGNKGDGVDDIGLLLPR
jgi:hypothetical protein